MHVGHGTPGGAGRELRLPDHRARRLVVGPELAAPAPGLVLLGVGRVAVAALGADDGVAALAEKQQAAGDEGRGAVGNAERRQVEVPQARVVPGAVAVGGHPRQLAAVEVEGGDAPVGGLGDGEPVGPGRRHAKLRSLRGRPGQGGVLVRRRGDAPHRGHGVGHRVVDPGLGVERPGVPVAGAPPAGGGQRTQLAAGLVAARPRRGEQGPQHQSLHRLSGRRPQLGSEVDQVVLGDALPVERRRLGGKRLGRRGPFARHDRLRHRTLLDRPDGLAGLAVEHVEERRLAGLHHRPDAPAVDGDVAEGRRAHGVVLPHVVVHHLEVPHPLAGGRVEGDEAVREEVVARPVPAVDHARRRRQRHVDVPERLVGGEAAPGPEVARIRGGAVAPRVRPELAGSWHHMERPQQLAGVDVEAADVFGGSLADDPAVAGPARDAGHDHDVAHHDGSGRPVEVAREGMVPGQVDPALVGEAERRGGASGPRIDRVQIPAPHEQQPPDRAVGPVRRSPRAAAGDLLERGGERRLPPDRLARGRVERLEQSDGVGGVEHTLDDHRRRPQIGVDPQIGKRLLHGRVHAGPPPDDLEVADVAVIDPVEGRVAREPLVAAEVAPFAGGLGRGRRGRRHGQHHGQERAPQGAEGAPRVGRPENEAAKRRSPGRRRRGVPHRWVPSSARPLGNGSLRRGR